MITFHRIFKVCSVFLLWLLVSCSGVRNNTEPTVISDKTHPIRASEIPVVSTPSFSAPLNPTPTERIFREPEDCDTTHVLGHILFLRTSVDASSSFDLYIMDGNACSKHLLMKNVSGSPAWSVDGVKISVGCEDNKYICILDAPASLDKCLNSGSVYGDCVPVITDKYALPSREDNTLIFNISWSFDDTKIIVESGDFSGNAVNVDILTLANNGDWQPLIIGDKLVHPEMSPVENKVIFDGLYILPLSSGPIQAKYYGFNGVWSHDGTKIAFLRTKIGDDDKELIGIAEWSFLETPHWRWLYEPHAIDKYYWPPQNLIIGSNKYRILSWSLDGRYLAFVAERTMFDSQIFRLDTITGEVIALTTKFEENVGYYAPAWGP